MLQTKFKNHQIISVNNKKKVWVVTIPFVIELYGKQKQIIKILELQRNETNDKFNSYTRNVTMFNLMVDKLRRQIDAIGNKISYLQAFYWSNDFAKKIVSSLIEGQLNSSNLRSVTLIGYIKICDTCFHFDNNKIIIIKKELKQLKSPSTFMRKNEVKAYRWV